MTNYYELLGVDPAAPFDEIRRAFRHEIARYHPDKVQHLGKEFQDLATTRAAELTQAYQALSDEKRRAEYDLQVREAEAGPAARQAAPPPASPPPAAAASGSSGRAAAAEAEPAEPVEPPAEKREKAVSSQFVRKAALGRFRDAVEAELGTYDQLSVKGFDVAYASRAKWGVFKKGPSPTRVLGRFVPRVDASSVQETWPLATKSGSDTMTVCVFLMGIGLASARELATAIAEQRRRLGRAASAIVVIPTDVRDWGALVPTDAPPTAKGIIERLRAPQ